MSTQYSWLFLLSCIASFLAVRLLALQLVNLIAQALDFLLFWIRIFLELDIEAFDLPSCENRWFIVVYD